MKMFTFPALTAGPPSRRNWYKELLNDAACNNDAARVKEAYAAHRDNHMAGKLQEFTNMDSNPVVPDQALLTHLAKQKSINKNTEEGYLRLEDELAAQDVNCYVIWARPPKRTLSLIRDLQQRLADLVGSDIHIIPLEDVHLSVIELSHRHSVPELRSVADEIGTSRLQSMLDLASSLSPKPGLILPQLNFDKMGVALTLLPSSDDAYTYHHLRSDMHAIALESGVSIDMCYTAPSAHITLGRFVGRHFFDSQERRSQFLDLIQSLNLELRTEHGSDIWRVGEDLSLESQLGYLKFGRPRKEADLLGAMSSHESF